MSERIYKIAIAGTSNTKSWKKHDVTLNVLLSILSAHREQATKDGWCFVPGYFAVNRTKTTVDSLDFAVYDIDGKQSIPEVLEKMRASGYAGVLHSTYSHMQSTTQLSVNKFTGWCKRRKYPTQLSEQRLHEFLVDTNKEHLTNVVIDYDIKKNSDGENVIEIHHDPIHKCRVVLPFKHRFVFLEADIDGQNAAKAWTALYLTIGRKLGLQFDESCSDASRLFYYPAHPPGGQYEVHGFGGITVTQPDNLKDRQAVADVEFDVSEDDLNLLDWRNYTLESKFVEETLDERGYTQRTQSQKTLPTIVEDSTGRQMNLSDWYHKHRNDFYVVELFQTYAPELIRKEVDAQGKLHIACPNAEMHSDPSKLDMATFVSDPDPDTTNNVWVGHCRHDGCQDFSSLMFLYKWIQDGTFTFEELESCAETHDIEQTNDQINESIVEEEQFISKKLADDSSDFAKSIEDRASAEVRGEKEAADAREITPYRSIVKSAIKAAHNVQYSDNLLNILKEPVYKSLKTEDELDIVARSKVPFPQLKRYHEARKDILPMDYAGLRGEIKTRRMAIYPVEQQLRDLIKRNLPSDVNAQRQHEIHSLTDVSLEEIKRTFLAIDKEINGDKVPDVLKDAYNEFSKYGKIKIGDDVRYIDKPMSIRNGKPSLWYPKALVEKDRAHKVFLQHGNGEREQIRPIEHWMNNNNNIDFYNGAMFDPSIKVAKRDGLFNLFDGFNNLHPTEGDWEMMYEHIKHIWCLDSEELLNWVFTYLASMLQRPGDRPSSAIALVGRAGVGKSVPIELGLKRMMEPYFKKTSERKDLVGQFNPLLHATVGLLAEETLFKNDKQTMDTLKDLISGQEIRMEAKFQDVKNVACYTRFFFTSNHEHFLGLEPDDRRFCVLQCSENKREQSFYTEMADRLRGENGYADMSAAWMYDLQRWNPEKYGISWGDLRYPPMTQSKIYQILMSFTTSEKFFFDLLVNGTITDVDERALVNGNVTWDYHAEESLIECALLHSVFRDYLYTIEHTQAKYQNTMTTAFYRVFGKKLSDFAVQKKIGKRNIKHYAFPSRKSMLIEMRKEQKITNDLFREATSIHEDNYEENNV